MGNVHETEITLESLNKLLKAMIIFAIEDTVG